ncbi:hypothetical protein RND81_01G216200 [Saponaria officinalis]|uniref:Uncharacterized protein n=1 Tax=Saponaria officinalis TaxID=3572 RepID=A0AAW1NGL2_SAPOF
MERSEPSLVPEWLRSNGGGGSIHHCSSSQTDSPVSALPGRSRSTKSINNTDFLHSPFLDRSSSSNSRRSSNINGFNKQDRSSYALSYSSFSRNHRDRDRERSGNADSWSSEYSDPLRGIMSLRAEDPLRRSKSLISRRQGDPPQRRISADMRNGGDKNHYNGNGTNSVGGNATGIQKVSFERDFPVLGSEERPKTPDVIRVSSPGLSRGIQSLSIGNTPSVVGEAWMTSSLVEAPHGSESNSGAGSLPATTSSSSSSVSVPANTSSGLNMAAALVQAPAQVHNTPQSSVQLQKDELAVAQSKKLIPLTPLVPKTMVLNPSDKLKPKTAGRSNDFVTGSKNGLHQLSDSPKSSGMSLLKPAREKGVSPVLKDIPSAVPNGSSTGVPSLISAPFNNPTNKKQPVNERKTSYSLSAVPMVDKRLSLAQLRSRNDFLNLIRKKSLASPTAVVDSGTVASSGMQNSDKSKETACGSATPTKYGEGKGDGDAFSCNMAKSYSGQEESHNEVVHTAEELEFLHALGWKEDEGDDEGLTEEEIDSFVRKYISSKPAAKLLKGLQLKTMPTPDSQGLCTTAAASKLSTSDTHI